MKHHMFGLEGGQSRMIRSWFVQGDLDVHWDHAGRLESAMGHNVGSSCI